MYLRWTLCILGLSTCSHALWPQPREYTHGSDVIWLSPAVQFSYYPNTLQSQEAGYIFRTTIFDWLPNWLRSSWVEYDANRKDSPPSVNQMIEEAVKRTKKDILHSRFVPWKFHPRNQSFEPSLESNFPIIKEVVINEFSSAQESSVRHYIDEDESYQIHISKSGKVKISTASPIGTLRSLETFRQLFYAHSSYSKHYTPYAPVFISDSPRWQHRGLNLDIARNVFYPKDVKRTIDALASTKMNRLHIHATDSQSWPLEIPSIPSLATKGSYHHSQIWSPSDLRDIQVYGLKRGVSMFLEIDLPGHTASIGHAFPELIAAFHMDKWEKYAAEPPSGQIKLNSSATFDFLEVLMEDLLPRVAPLTEYFHTGGDEFNLNTYLLEQGLGSNDKKVLKPLLQKIVAQVHEHIWDSGLTPIIWEELILDWNLDLPSSVSSGAKKRGGVIVQAWRNTKAVRNVLEKGYRTIFGSGDAWYLDCGLGTFLNPRPGSKSVQEPFLDWCAPLKNWRHMFLYNPLKGIPEELQSLIIGGEAHMWSEHVDTANMDQVIWPRAATAGEVLWSGPRNVRQIQDASFRLAEWRERAVVDLQVGASMAQMTYCLLRESGCES